jgi:hypothetical protein
MESDPHLAPRELAWDSCNIPEVAAQVHDCRYCDIITQPPSSG